MLAVLFNLVKVRRGREEGREEEGREPQADGPRWRNRQRVTQSDGEEDEEGDGWIKEIDS